MKKEQPKKTTVNLMCPNLLCRKILMVPGIARGRRVRCTYCGMTLKVPLEKRPFFSHKGIKEKVPDIDASETSGDS